MITKAEAAERIDVLLDSYPTVAGCGLGEDNWRRLRLQLSMLAAALAVADGDGALAMHTNHSLIPADRERFPDG